MGLGIKEHLKRQLNKHCNYKNENQQSFSKYQSCYHMIAHEIANRAHTFLSYWEK